MEPFAFEESWDVIRKVFPADLESLARHSGSFRRARVVEDAQTLLRLLLMHGSGLSLEQTALRAKEQGLGKLSAVALFKRLRRSGPFLQRLAFNVLEQVQQRASKANWPGGVPLPHHRCDHGERTGPDGQLLAPPLQPAAAGVVLRPF